MSTMTLDTLFQPSFEGAVRAPRSQVRLTRRGRMAVLAAALLVAFVIGVFVSAAGSVATEHPGKAEPTRIIQVTEGDTLWDIASGVAHQPGQSGDIRAMMTKIEQLNALDSSEVLIGQRLVVPAG